MWNSLIVGRWTRLAFWARVALIVILLLGLAMPAHVPSAAAAPPPCADLVVTNFTIQPDQPVRDQNVEISITIKNQGTCKAFSFVVQWKSDRFAPTGPSTQVAELGPAESTTVRFEYAFPRAGNFLTIVTIDTSNSVPETNEINNIEIHSVSVRAPTVDLTISAFTVVPDPAVQGRVAHVSITVENQGNTAAGSFLVQWKPGPLIPDLTNQVNSLGIGQSVTVGFDFTYFNDGQFLSHAEVDSSNRIIEADETNNSQTRIIKVDPPLPDLIIEDITVNPAQPVQRSVTTVSITIKNQGHNPARNFLVQWKPAPLIDDLSTQINNLEAGASTTVNFDYTYTRGGDFLSIAVVDSTRRVIELDENNNTKTLQITVQPSSIDLTIVDFTADPAQPTQGSNTHIVITIKNLGNTAAKNFVVEWTPSAAGLNTPGPSTLSKQIDLLGPGETLPVSFDFIYPKYGNFRTIAKVDAFNNVLESNEANNIDLLNLTVSPAPIDLIITSFTIDPAEPTRGSKVKATITVKNNGTFPTDRFAVQWQPIKGSAGKTMAISGLNPGDSQTVTLEAAYFQAGSFESAAIVDVFDQVIETNENNNTNTISVKVKPRQTGVKVTFNNVQIHEAFEDGAGCIIDVECVGEWRIIFAVLDPDSTCQFGDKEAKGVRCEIYSNDDVEDNEEFGIGISFDFTLVESTPLVIAAAGFEVDDLFGLPTGGMFTGAVVQLSSAADYPGIGTMTLPSQQGPCNNGDCFNLTFTVEVTNPPPPLAAELGGQEEKPPQYMLLPANMPLPNGMSLPAGLRRAIYLPIALH
jgi:subtilase family serine protease